jgi:hypothetical protein
MPASYRDHFDGQNVALAHQLIAQHAADGDVDWMADALDWFVDATVELLDHVEDLALVVLHVKVRLALAAGLEPADA